MAKKTLKVATPVGEFTRTTNTAYTHVVVRTSVRVKAFFDAHKPGAKLSGVDTRWVKDRGYAVTWHGSKEAANSAVAKGYDWDSQTTLVGVFEVLTPLIDDNGGTSWVPEDPAVTFARDAALIAAHRAKRAAT